MINKLSWKADLERVRKECLRLLKNYYMQEYDVDENYARYLAERQLEWDDTIDEFKEELAFMTDKERLENLL